MNTIITLYVDLSYKVMFVDNCFELLFMYLRIFRYAYYDNMSVAYNQFFSPPIYYTFHTTYDVTCQ